MLLRTAAILLVAVSLGSCVQSTSTEIFNKPGFHTVPGNTQVHGNCKTLGAHTRSIDIVCPNHAIKIWLENGKINYDEGPVAFDLTPVKDQPGAWSVRFGPRPTKTTIIGISTAEERIVPAPVVNNIVILKPGGITAIWIQYFLQE